MNSNKELRQLLEYASGLRHPFNFALDVVIARFPELNVINKYRKKISKPDPRYITKAGFHGFEFGLWYGSLFDKNWNINKTRLNALKDSNLKLSRFHACFEMIPETLQGIHLNLASRNIEKSIKALLSHIQVVRAVTKEKKPVLVVHLGYPEKGEDMNSAERNIIAVLSAIIPALEKESVYIGIENLLHTKDVQFVGTEALQIRRIIEACSSRHICATFDWGHANTVAYAKNVKSNFEYIDKEIKILGNNIVHAHLNYNSCCESSWAPNLSMMKKITKLATKMSKKNKVTKAILAEPLDEHQPITSAKGEYRIGYKQNLQTLFSETRIKEYGFVTHEVDPKTYLGVIPFNSHGATMNDHKDAIQQIQAVYQAK